MKRRIAVVSASAVAAALVASSAGDALAGEDFSFNPPGTLTSGSGTGRFDETVYAPGMRFPIEETPAFANSQVWGNGGGSGPGGSQCDVENFSYPWWDNYCETRSWDMPLCPSGQGHQGQDIRAQTCDDNVHWVVASEAGTVTNAGTYALYITAADGTRYDYLHMGSWQVGLGDEITKGQRIGKVSNEFGGTPTTVHLHFNLRQNVTGLGNVYVPTYMSLVTSYQSLIGPPVEPSGGALDAVGCDAIRGWTQSPSDPDAPIDVRLYFDGAADDGMTVGHPFLADRSREDLCATAGCEHGFEVVPPLSLFDGKEHPVHAYASDGSSAVPELSGSPSPMQCSFEVPAGVRRRVRDAESANAWRFSPFWDQIAVSDGIIGALDEGSELAAAPRIVATAAAPEVLWWVDGDQRRAVGSEAIATAWELDPIAAEILSDAELDALPEGKPLRQRPVVLRSASGDLWLVDDPVGQAPDDPLDPPEDGDGAASDVEEGCTCSAASTERKHRLAIGSWLAALGLVVARRRASGRRK